MGLIIALEGPDGVGKTTVSNYIVETLRERRKKVERLVDPGTTRLGTTIRPLVLDPDYPLTPQELCLLFAAMSSALLRYANDFIAKGADLVILDRCFLSNYPYRMADGVYPGDLDWIYSFVDAIIPADRVFILSAPPEVRQARLTARPGSGKDRFESKPPPWKASLAVGYDWCLAKKKGTEIDANRPTEAVARDILGRIGFLE